MGLVLHAEAAMRHRKQFAEHESVELKAQVSHTLAHWHENVPRELLHIETLTWMGLEKEASPPGNSAEALDFAQRLTTSLQPGREKVAAISATIRRCAQAMLGSLPDIAYKALPELEHMWAAAYDGVAGVRVPHGLNPSFLYAEKARASTPRWWSIRQVGNTLVFALSEGSAWPSADTGPGSPLAWLYCAGPNLFVQWSREQAERQLVLKEGLTIPLQSYQSLTLRSDRSSITIASWSKEPWAVAAGRDRYGLWADADVKGVSLRFRWIPPGRFLMGSPEQEAGRDDDEGPQHEVTWTAGRWLADVPCTQALWQAVQGENPSRFVSPERPVERVSWEDCDGFLRKLNTLIPGLAARLPSEAEWEHACRAGTQRATWMGDLEILGENNAPLLDDIAWYGGNSGEEFELENGYDSSDWRGKQYLGSRSGTHPVRQKDENPFGLFDVLGNVLEWCMDGMEEYKVKPLLNPDAHLVGSYRVLRGGAWYGHARGVRTASRFGRVPGSRVGSVGFRVARGPGASLPPRSGDRAIPPPKKKK
jgi:formylglycine-generating enzyme required for sulfatase activity